jgi:hypothetical protein
MSAQDLVNNGGLSVHQLGVMGGYSSHHLFDYSAIYELSINDTKMLAILTPWAFLILLLMFILSLYQGLNNGNEKVWRDSILKLVLCTSFVYTPFYLFFVKIVVDTFQSIISFIYSDEIALDGMFEMMKYFETSMLDSALGGGMWGFLTMSPNALLEGIAHIIFAVVFYILPFIIKTLLEIWVIIGQLCLATILFKPLAGVAGLWMRMLVAGMMIALMQLFVFIIFLEVGLIGVMTAFKAYSNPFVPITIAGVSLIVIVAMPGVVFQMVGGFNLGFAGAVKTIGTMGKNKLGKGSKK